MRPLLVILLMATVVGCAAQAPSPTPTATALPEPAPTPLPQYAPISAWEAHDLFYASIRQGQVQIPVPFDITQGGKVREVFFNGHWQLGAVGLPEETVFYAPVDAGVSDSEVPGFHILEVGLHGTYIRFYFVDAEFLTPAEGEIVEPGTPLFRTTEGTAPSPELGGLQVVFAVVFDTRVETLSWENLLRTGEGEIVYIAGEGGE